MQRNTLSIQQKKDYEAGVALATLSYVIWGVLPIYWKAMEPVSPLLIMLYRLVMAFIFVLALVFICYKPKEIIAPLKQKRAVLIYFASGCLISLNWGIYIWAVNSGQILQTSMGYYINPLITVLFSVLFFKDKLNTYKVVALAIACLGVLIMLIGAGEVPGVALGLAFTFAIYSAIKKRLKANSLLALLYETAFLTPFALIGIVYMETNQFVGLIQESNSHYFILVGLSGVVTAVPLLFFAAATNRVSLTTVGFLQYISPTIGLFLGIFIFHETFDTVKLISFVFIWIALAIYIFSEVKGKSEFAKTTIT